jgi:hypothetical protein
MLIGYPPFFSDNPTETCQKIIKWKQYFKFPEDPKISPEAENLIRKLMSPSETRLGLSGSTEIKKHPFFRGLDWESVRNVKPPFIPNVKLYKRYFRFHLNGTLNILISSRNRNLFTPLRKKLKREKILIIQVIPITEI